MCRPHPCQRLEHSPRLQVRRNLVGEPLTGRRRRSYAERSKAFCVKRRFRRPRVPQISGKHTAAVDRKCQGFAQAHRAADCHGMPFIHSAAKGSATGTSSHCECAEGIESGLESLGDGLQQREFLSRHTRSSGVTAEWLLGFIGVWSGTRPGPGTLSFSGRMDGKQK